MSSRRAESNVRGPRHPALTATAAVLLTILVLIMALAAGMWSDTRQTSSVFNSRIESVTTLANVNREASRLGVLVERAAGTVPGPEIAERRALLENQLRHHEARIDDPTGTEDETSQIRATAIRTALSIVDPLLAVERPWTDEERSRLRSGLDDLELAVKQAYDHAEVRHFDAIATALDERRELVTLLAVGTAVLTLFAVLWGVAARRANRADHDEAYLALAGSEARLRQVFDSVKDVIFATDDLGRWTFLSRAWEDLIGIPTDDALGRPFLEFVHPEDAPTCPERFAALFDGETTETRHEVRYVRADGEAIWVEVWVCRSGDGGTFGTLVDITERRRFEEQLQHQALHDPLTGLANRQLLVDRLEQSLAHGARTGSHTAVLFLDLDRFKVVNDSLGHDVGDQLLCEVGQRLVGRLRAGDTVARLGGDEFVVVCSDLDDDEVTAMEQARAVATDVERQLAAPFRLLDQRVTVTASIGITLGQGPSSLDRLVSEADAAMYRAKDEGRARSAVFDDRLRARAARRLLLEQQLRDALALGEFELYHQPILDVATGAAVATEALLRWNHPERGTLGPGDFLDVAEDAGLMPAIGCWVVHEACRQAAAWRCLPGISPDFAVAVNLSARELGSSDLVDVIHEALQASDLPAHALTVEVTEHHLIDGQADVIEHLRIIHSLGVRIAMDDFGTGYSSLSYLRKLPLHQLKIDQSFVSRLGVDPDDDVIVRTVADLGRALGLVTVAEGVELPSQLRRLRDLGVARVQGYLLGAPGPAAQVAPSLIVAPQDTARPTAV